MDRAIAQIRLMRSALAVKAGMTLENAPIPTIPNLDTEADRVALEQMMASLPLLRKPLTPEQRARIQPISTAQDEQMKAVLDEVIANKEAFEQLMEGDEQPIPFEKIIELRESFDKTEMIGEFERELMAYMEEVQAFRDDLEKRLELHFVELGERGVTHRRLHAGRLDRFGLM
ncbi:MAG: hypothetical protein IPM54_34540 [Polyangiaceae bacterium]|nr:hypothetical protein [Polyangiaceae bacterium]